MSDPLIGSEIGGCLLRRRVGSGGIGIVYEARHVASGRVVAVKVLLEEAARRPGLRERFQREARLAYSLEHPHVVRVYTWGEERGSPYLVMEYVDGTTLENLVVQKGPLAWPVAAKVVADIANALGHVHAIGVVHRDVKPSNVLISRLGQAKLTDLGLARQFLDALDEVGGRRITAPGSSIGSPAFMAPEQITDTSRAGIPADIYGLGATLYYCLASRTPFNAPTTTGVLRKVLLDTPPSIDDLVPGLPPSLVALVAACLEKDPARRPALCQEVEDALRAAVAGACIAPLSVAPLAGRCKRP